MGIASRLARTTGALHALSVGDLDRAIAWYTEHLGFELQSRADNESRRGALLSRPGSLLELAQFADAEPRNADVASHQIHGIFKLGFSTTDLEQSFDVLQRAGVDVFFPIVSASDGTRTFAIKDPEGNIVQFFGH